MRRGGGGDVTGHVPPEIDRDWSARGTARSLLHGFRSGRWLADC